ncbi:MAG TPA: hypothetical protein VGH53_13530 [Streptosporangiaceae bacterium]
MTALDVADLVVIGGRAAGRPTWTRRKSPPSPFSSWHQGVSSLTTWPDG